MKATIDMKRKARKLALVMALILTAASINAQGILLEGASKLFHSLFEDRNESEFLFTTTHLTRQGDIYSINADYHPVVVDRIAMDDLTIVYEPRVETEDWMSVSLADKTESPVKTEKWMEQSISKNIETAPVVEKWMTQPVSGNIESKVELEDWMTAPLFTSGITIEEKIEIERWMTAMLV